MANLPKDPDILLSVVNMKLRDGCDSLEDLCEELDVEQNSLEETLRAAGYVYDREGNRFR